MLLLIVLNIVQLILLPISYLYFLKSKKQLAEAQELVNRKIKLIYSRKHRF